jgi:hypothetical protein
MACAKDILVTVDKAFDSSLHSAEEESGETVLSHCFMHDPGSLLAMSMGLFDDAQGSHLVILSRSNRRLTTRYNGPIRFSRTTKKKQSLQVLPVVECECNIHNSKEFVNILYGQ